MAFSTATWKYVLLALNVVLSISGLAFISCGVVTLGGIGSTWGAYSATLVGFLVFFICLVGCCAALRESYLLAMAFLGAAAVGVVVQIAFMVAFSIMRESFMEMGVKRIDANWVAAAGSGSGPGPDSVEPTVAMERIQHQYSCCGKDSPQDYKRDDDDDDILPRSCCRHNNCSVATNVYALGCTGSLLKFFDDHGNYLILISLVTVALEALSLAAAFYMGTGLRTPPPQKLEHNGPAE